MKWLWRSLFPLLLAACFASLVTACKSRTPELTGKWSGNSDLSTQMARAPGSLQMQNAKAVPVQVTMTLNQNGGGVTGDAAVVISGKPEIHLPITAGVVGQDGKVSIEADRSYGRRPRPRQPLSTAVDSLPAQDVGTRLGPGTSARRSSQRRLPCFSFWRDRSAATAQPSISGSPELLDAA
jgi:hypothetical protein